MFLDEAKATARLWIMSRALWGSGRGVDLCSRGVWLVSAFARDEGESRSWGSWTGVLVLLFVLSGFHDLDNAIFSGA